jgi:hypothetical protein
MSKTAITCAILIGIVGFLLVFPVASNFVQTASSQPQQLSGWSSSGDTQIGNYSATMVVTPMTYYSSLASNQSLSSSGVLSIMWIDSANISNTTYQVRVLQNGSVADVLLSSSNSASWSVGPQLTDVAHTVSLNLLKGNYTILYSLEGTSGNVSISRISVVERGTDAIADDISTYTPLLIVFTVGVGLLAVLSNQASVKRELEHLETMLKLTR